MHIPCIALDIISLLIFLSIFILSSQQFWYDGISTSFTKIVLGCFLNQFLAFSFIRPPFVSWFFNVMAYFVISTTFTNILKIDCMSDVRCPSTFTAGFVALCFFASRYISITDEKYLFYAFQFVLLFLPRLFQILYFRIIRAQKYNPLESLRFH